MPSKYKEAVEKKYPGGDEVRIKAWVLSNYEMDQAAIAFFHDRSKTGIDLDEKKKREYIINASVLNCCIKLYERARDSQRPVSYTHLDVYKRQVLVCLNRFATDIESELEIVRNHCEKLNVPFAINTAYTDGGVGAENLARLVVKTIDEHPSKQLHYVYEEDDTILDKIEKIAKGIYGAERVVIKPSAMRKLRNIEGGEFSHYPVCIAKTQYSFSDDAVSYTHLMQSH